MHIIYKKTWYIQLKFWGMYETIPDNITIKLCQENEQIKAIIVEVGRETKFHW